MAKQLTQITFDFSAPAADQQVAEETISSNQGVGIRNIIPKVPQKKPDEVITPRKSTRGRRSLKEGASEADLVQVPPDEILFQKQYYAIGEVAKMFRVNQSLIRYWDSEFDILQPKKNGKGDRFFRAIDVRNLELIHDLLRRRKFTIEGAREYLKNNEKSEEKFAMIQSLERIRSFLLELKASL